MCGLHPGGPGGAGADGAGGIDADAKPVFAELARQRQRVRQCPRLAHKLS